MYRSFFVTLFVASLTLASCGGNDEDAAQKVPPHGEAADDQRRSLPIDTRPTPLPNGMQLDNTYSKSAIDSLLKLPITERPQSPSAAADYYLTVPPKMGIPPHTLPAKNIKVESENDSTAIIAYQAQHAPMDCRLELFKVSDGMNYTWLVRRSVILHQPG